MIGEKKVSRDNFCYEPTLCEYIIKTDLTCFFFWEGLLCKSKQIYVYFASLLMQFKIR